MPREPLLNLRLPEVEARELSRLAADRGVSRSALVREAIRRQLLEKVPTEKVEAL